MQLSFINQVISPWHDLFRTIRVLPAYVEYWSSFEQVPIAMLQGIALTLLHRIDQD